MTNKSKYNRLSLKQKSAILRCIASGTSYADIQSEFQVSAGSITKIKKSRAQILQSIADNQSGSSRLSGIGEKLDKRVYDWFVDVRSRNIPVTGALIQQSAMKAAQSLQMTDFKASNGWLNNFQKRHNIFLRQLSGESAELDMETVNHWRENIMELMDGYELKDILNCDETGLFYRALPSHTLSAGGDSCKGASLQKKGSLSCWRVRQWERSSNLW